MSTRSLAAVLGAVLVLSLAACSTSVSTTDDAPTGEPSASSTSSSTAEAASTAPSDAPADASKTADAPAAGTDAAVAWNALMGLDGEYAAAASYAAVIDAFGPVEPYVSIKAAEERHIDALIRQLERLGVTVPENPYLGELAAPADLQTAATAWAVGEVANVEMYDELLSQTTNANLIKVLTNLRNASLDSHLPLFEAAAANGGTLSADEMGGMGH